MENPSCFDNDISKVITQKTLTELGLKLKDLLTKKINPHDKRLANLVVNSITDRFCSNEN